MKLKLEESDKKLLKRTALILLFTVFLSFILADSRFTLGLFIGGVLSFLNYFWLDFSVRYILEKAAKAEEASLSGAFIYLLKYLVVAVLVFLLKSYFSENISIIAVMLGFLAFPASIILEGFTLAIKTFTAKERT
ncbi:MAG: ATP synthase subunit I [Pyrinomonadaceae bacterium]|nr:ATP synthase subunit I [Pyrinomonadaceae bacterium]MCX7639023.1 ATP synthase subunit I [Pyrinomonadaceae bacterium]MDW8303756.1 ATP synthase subunit I [Acidobacteriota bacterium]